MSPRSSLIDSFQRDRQQQPTGTPVDPVMEAEFVHGNPPSSATVSAAPSPPSSANTTEAATHPAPGSSTLSAALAPGLIPVNVRIRPELARALKTASLTRQLSGTTPFCKREIVEQALEAWLRAEGYVK
jgi:hypothetical protein